MISPRMEGTEQMMRRLFCIICGEPRSGTAYWCDDCRDDHKREVLWRKFAEEKQAKKEQNNER